MRFLRSVKGGMQEFGHDIATLVNTTLLLIVYIIGVGATAIIARLFGKRFLKTDLGRKTYWNDLALTKREEDAYYRQF